MGHGGERSTLAFATIRAVETSMRISRKIIERIGVTKEGRFMVVFDKSKLLAEALPQ